MFKQFVCSKKCYKLLFWCCLNDDDYSDDEYNDDNIYNNTTNDFSKPFVTEMDDKINDNNKINDNDNNNNNNKNINDNIMNNHQFNSNEWEILVPKEKEI